MLSKTKILSYLGLDVCPGLCWKPTNQLRPFNMNLARARKLDTQKLNNFYGQSKEKAFTIIQTPVIFQNISLNLLKSQTAGQC